ncbi:hypothetical protein [Ancylomarina sp.]|uniref:hypothetical protein n=1 Tax=Ancylomarina sp. TaxID=1970196 RepID=UPI0035613D0F
MKKRYSNLREMLRRFIDFTQVYQIKLDEIPVVKEIIALILGLNVNFETVWAIKEKDYKGTTLTKRNKKNTLALQLSKINQLITNYCIKTNELEDIENFKGGSSVYSGYSDGRLITKANLSIEYCDSLAEKLAETGISESMLADLKDAYEGFKALTPRPKEIQSTTKIATGELSIIAKQIISLFRYRLDRVMKSMFEQDDPDLYKAYVEARDIEKVGHRKIAITGHILDKLTKQPVPQAHFIIEEANIDHKCIGELGGFRIKSVEPGSYTARIEAVTYKSISLQLVHRFGETNVFEIEMETEESHSRESTIVTGQ